MKNHVILCGLGHIGFRIAELLLRLNEQVSIITDKTKGEWKDQIESKGIQIIIGDASDDRRLIEAGIREAKALIAATDNDLINVSVALDAKRLNPKINVVVRLFDQLLAQRLEQHLDVRKVFSTSLLAAPEFAAAALGDEILSSFQEGDSRFTLGRFHVDSIAASKYATVEELEVKENVVVITRQGKEPTIGQVQKKDHVAAGDDLLVLDTATARFLKPTDAQKQRMRRSRALNIGESFFKTFSFSTWIIFTTLVLIVLISTALFGRVLQLDPVTALYYVITTITTTGYGDINLLNAGPFVKLYGCFLMLCGAAFLAALFGTITNFFVQKRLEQFFGKHTVPKSGHIVVIGSGNIGYRVIQELIVAGQEVVLVNQEEKDESVQSCRELCAVVLGSVKTQDVLLKANITTAKTILAITEDDVANLSVGLTAKEINAKARVVLRVFNPALAAKARGILNVDAILSTSMISAPAFVGAALYPDVKSAVVSGNSLILCHHHVISEGSSGAGKTLFEIGQGEDQRCLLIKKAGGKFERVSHDSRISAGQEWISVRIKPLTPVK